MSAPRPPRPEGSPGRRWAPAVVGVAVILALGVAALRIGSGSLRAAEDDRIASRVNLVTLIGANLGFELNPGARGGVTTVPFVLPEHGPVNEALLGQMRSDPAVTGVAFVAVLTRDWRMVQAVPADTTVDVAKLGDAWNQAIRGQMVLADAFTGEGGSQITTTLWPVGEGEPWGVVAFGEVLAHTSTQTFLAQLGSQNGEPGGLFIADRRGVAVAAWDAGLIGTPVVAPDEVRSLAPGERRVTTTGSGENGSTMILTPLVDGFVIGFEQDTDLLLGDLRDAQHQRDLTLVGVLGAALVLLILFQLAREVAARRDEARVDALLRNGQDVVAVVGADGTVSFASAAVEGLLQRPAVDWLGQPATRLCHPDDAPRLWDLVRDPGSGPLRDLRLLAGHGGCRWFDVEASDLRSHPEVGGVLLTCHEIGERKALQHELSHQATHDRLTGLANRAELDRHLEALVVDGRPVRPFGLLYLDLDRFKPVNDTLGHDAGDHVLVAMAERLRAVPPPGAVVARLGGDEFAIVVDVADEGEAAHLAEALLHTVRAPVSVAGTTVQLDASIGIALADPADRLHTAQELVRQADEAMYRAKKGGRGRFERAVPVASDVLPLAPIPEPTPPLHRSPRPPSPSSSGPVSRSTGESDAPVGHHRTRRRSVAAIPLLVAGAVVVGIAAVGFTQTASSQREAERRWLQENVEGAARSAVFYSARFSPRWFKAMADAGPWTLDGSALDQSIVTMWATTPTTGPDGFSALIGTDGRVLASYPPGITTSVTADPTWPDVLAGEAVYLPWIEDSDQPRSYEILPIHRDGEVAGVVAVGVSVRAGSVQQALERGGGSSYGTGGWSLLDQDGRVYSSWDPGNIGRQLASVPELTAVAPGEARVLDRADDVVIVAPMTSTAVPTYLALDVPAATFYRDLRLGQHERDLSLLALVVAAVAGLAWAAFRREQAVRRREARLDALLQNAHDVVVVLDGEGRATFVSSAVQRLLGYDPRDALGQNLIGFVHPDDRASFAGLVPEVRTTGSASRTDLRVRSADGTDRYVDVRAVDRHDHPEIRGIVVTAHDVTERKALQDELAFRASRDPLTGLANRASLMARLEQLSDADDSFAILFIDLDHFKPVNDTYGHDTGDEVLRVIAQRFRQSVRSSEDDGPDRDLVCRLGGDEFAIVLRDVTEASARATGTRLLEAARRPIRVGDQVVQIGATIGIAVTRATWGHPDQAVRQADQAMYKAKQAGRNTMAMVGTL